MGEPVAAPPQQQASGQAITALVLGIIGAICCFFVAPIAWFLANAELKAIRQGSASKAGEGVATAGKILGMIGTLLLVLFALWIFFMGGLAFLHHHASRW